MKKTREPRKFRKGIRRRPPCRHGRTIADSVETAEILQAVSGFIREVFSPSFFQPFNTSAFLAPAAADSFRSRTAITADVESEAIDAEFLDPGSEEMTPDLRSHKMRNPTHTFAYSAGTTVTVYCPKDAQVEYDSWLKGPIIETIATCPTAAVHVVRPAMYRPQGEGWRRYNGVPEILGRQVEDSSTLEFIDTWPRKP